MASGDFIARPRGAATQARRGNAVDRRVDRQSRLLEPFSEVHQVLACPLVCALLVALAHGRRDLAVGVEIARGGLRQRVLQQGRQRPVQQAERFARHHQRAVPGRARDQRMKRRVELPMALDPRFVGLAAHRCGRGDQVLVDLAQVVLVRTLRGETRGLGLDDDRHLPQLLERHLVQDQRTRGARRRGRTAPARRRTVDALGGARPIPPARAAGSIRGSSSG